MKNLEIYSQLKAIQLKALGNYDICHVVFTPILLAAYLKLIYTFLYNRTSFNEDWVYSLPKEFDHYTLR